MTTTLQVLADGATGLAGGHPGPGLAPAATAVRVLFLLAAAVTAGAALLRPLRPATPTTRHWTRVAAATAALSGLATIPLAGAPAPLITATVAVLLAAHLTPRPAIAATLGGATSVLLAAGLVTTPRPEPPPAAGRPLLTSVTLDGAAVPVLITPNRPGPNLVHIGAGRAAVGRDPRRLALATTRPGATGTWARITLAAGPGRLWISTGGPAAALTVDPGHRPAPAGALDGPDGPECAAATLGALLNPAGAAPGACPADALSGADAEALRAAVGHIAARGVREIALTGDSSPRGTAATAEVRAAARRAGLRITAPGARRPLIIVAGWSTADPLLRKVGAGAVAAEGTYLAPWLLTAPLLEHPAGQLLPLRFDPRGRSALDHLAALRERFPGAAATTGGYTAWRPAAATGDIRLYAASRIWRPGGHGSAAPGAHHGDQAIAWFPSGTVVAVSAPLTGDTLAERNGHGLSSTAPGRLR